MRVQQFNRVTRVEVIGPKGRIFVGYFDAPGAEIHMQDADRTIKIFTEGERTGVSDAERELRDRELHHFETEQENAMLRAENARLRGDAP